MQKITKTERFEKTPLKIQRQKHGKLFNPNELDRKFPSLNELLPQKNETLFSRNDEREFSNDPFDLEPEEKTISIWIPQDSISVMNTEKVEVKLDQQVIIDDIAKTIALAAHSVQESTAVLNLTVGGEAVIVEIVKRRNKTKVRFSSENLSVRRLLKNTKVELADAAVRAGLKLDRIEVR